MVVADIFNETNLSAVTATTTGSAINTFRLARKSVFVSALTNGSGTGTGSQLFVQIQASPDNSNWYLLDNKRYESGTATQKDIFSYNSHFPYMRTVAIGSNIGALTVSTTVTGRGI